MKDLIMKLGEASDALNLQTRNIRYKALAKRHLTNKDITALLYAYEQVKEDLYNFLQDYEKGNKIELWRQSNQSS